MTVLRLRSNTDRLVF